MISVTISQDAWDDDSEGVLSNWRYRDGDTVSEGSVIAEITNEKLALELVAPAAGKLSILVTVDQAISKGDEVARIDNG